MTSLVFLCDGFFFPSREQYDWLLSYYIHKKKNDRKTSKQCTWRSKGDMYHRYLLLPSWMKLNKTLMYWHFEFWTGIQYSQVLSLWWNEQLRRWFRIRARSRIRTDILYLDLNKADKYVTKYNLFSSITFMKLITYK